MLTESTYRRNPDMGMRLDARSNESRSREAFKSGQVNRTVDAGSACALAARRFRRLSILRNGGSSAFVLRQ